LSRINVKRPNDICGSGLRLMRQFVEDSGLSQRERTVIETRVEQSELESVKPIKGA
jgi:diaminopimelate epimerase